MRYVATLPTLMISSAAMSAPQSRTITTALPANRPIGVGASAFVRSVKAGAVSEHANYKDQDLLLVGKLLALRSGKQVDIAVLASADQKERLKALIQHDARLVTGKLTSIACRRVDGRGPVVVVSNCRLTRLPTYGAFKDIRRPNIQIRCSGVEIMFRAADLKDYGENTRILHTIIIGVCEFNMHWPQGNRPWLFSDYEEVTASGMHLSFSAPSNEELAALSGQR